MIAPQMADTHRPVNQSFPAKFDEFPPIFPGTMTMAWTRLEDTFHDHVKLDRLAERLGIRRAEAKGLMASLWSWALKHAPNGCLGKFSVREIEKKGMDWEGEPGAAYAAVIDSNIGLIDVFDGVPWIHEVRNGSLREAERKRNERSGPPSEATSESVLDASGTNPGRVQETSALEQNRIEENREEKRREETTLSVSPSDPDGVSGDAVALQIRQVFGRYQEYHPRAHKRPHSKMKEWSLVRARLNDGYSVQELCRAIDGCHKSPFHQGENERNQKYDSLELIMRDASKVNRFIEMADVDPLSLQSTASERTRRSGRAGAAWLKAHEERTSPTAPMEAGT